jgi:proteasome lid subunit RPN8/RPN11
VKAEGRTQVKRLLERHARAEMVEECWTLVGARRGRVWLARRLGYSTGEAVSVEFDGPAALRREERRGDVVGFLHTHPSGALRPSRRDVRTMRAWCSAFGKPLLCLIARGERVEGVRFDDDESDGVPLETAELFPGGLVVAVDRA